MRTDFRYLRADGMRVAASSSMQIDLDPTQAEVLRETLVHLLHDLRVESARTDAHDFREMLHRRERVVEAVLEKLPVIS